MFTIHRIIFFRFACPPMEIIISSQYFCKKKFCGTNAYMQMSIKNISVYKFNKLFNLLSSISTSILETEKAFSSLILQVCFSSIILKEFIYSTLFLLEKPENNTSRYSSILLYFSIINHLKYFRKKIILCSKK